MKDCNLRKKPDLGIFDRSFPIRLESAPLDIPAQMTILTGSDGILDDLFSYQVYNYIKNHWRAAAAPADIQDGMIWSETVTHKLYHHAGAADEEILQLTRSSDVSPYFANLYLAEYLYHTGDTDTHIQFQNDQITLQVGGKDFINMVEAGTDFLQLLTGKNFIGDVNNADMTVGLTINQLGNDDEIFAGKSSDVAHGMTDQAETDTYFNLGKSVADSGGLKITGFTQGVVGVRQLGYYTTDDDVKSVDGRAAIESWAAKKSGTNYGDVGADANIFAMRCYIGAAWKSRWILDEDGDTWQPGEVDCASLARLCLGAPTELTIDGAGAITVTGSYHTVDGAGDAVDDLVTINGGADGMILVLQAEHIARQITVKETGNISLTVADFVLNSLKDKITLIYDATTVKWCELSRADNE